MKLSFQPLVIGSHALVRHLDKLHIDHNLEPLDHDIIVPNQKSAYEFIDYLRQFNSSLAIEKITTSKKFKTGTIVLNHYGSMWELTFPTSKKSTTYQLYHGFEHEVQLAPKLPETINYANYMYASLDLLYTLKMSHRYLRNSPHFHKTMKHIKNMRKIGAKIIDEQFYQARMKETYDYATPKLNVGKSDFFHSNFNYIYDHDSIHRAVKLLDKPAYEYYMTENQEVHCDKDRFFAQSKAVQLLGVLEESYVLALERSQIPNEFMVRPYESFMIALEKVCTSITSGWFREFAWENFDVVTNLYNDDYITKFTNAMKDGIILPYKPLLFVSLIAIALTGCVKSAEQLEREQAAEAKECSFGGGIRQAVKNNWTYRDDIKKDYRACIAGNSNRDVVYNDTNELAKTCLESAHKLNGGVVANNWSGYTEGYLARVEKSLRDCGEIN